MIWISSHAYVIRDRDGGGRVLAQGTAEEIKRNEQVIEAYLGTGIKNQKADEVNV